MDKGGILLFFLIGLGFSGVALWKMLILRTFSFKNKKVIVQARVTLLLGSIGVMFLLYWMFAMLL